MIQSMTKAGIWTRSFVSVCTRNMECKVGQSCSSWEMLYLFLQGLHIRWVEFWATLQKTGFLKSYTCSTFMNMWTKFGTWQPIHIISSPSLLFWLLCIHFQCLPCHPYASSWPLFVFCCCWPEIHIPDMVAALSKRGGNSSAEGSCKASPGRRQRDGPPEQAWQRCKLAAPWAKVAAIDIVQALASLATLPDSHPFTQGAATLLPLPVWPREHFLADRSPPPCHVFTTRVLGTPSCLAPGSQASSKRTVNVNRGWQGRW